MGVRHFFRNIFKQYNIKKTSKGFSVDINFDVVGDVLDRAQFNLDNQVWVDMRQYMPWRDGTLIAMTNELNQQVAGKGMVYLYDPMLEYAHYQYEGIVYVDPVYRVGGFYSPNYGWWSRPGVTKVPSGQPLFYNNPKAESHWDEVAYDNHHKEWVDVVRKTIRGKL